MKRITLQREWEEIKNCAHEDLERYSTYRFSAMCNAGINMYRTPYLIEVGQTRSRKSVSIAIIRGGFGKYEQVWGIKEMGGGRGIYTLGKLDSRSTRKRISRWQEKEFGDPEAQAPLVSILRKYYVQLVSTVKCRSVDWLLHTNFPFIFRRPAFDLKRKKWNFFGAY